MLIGLNRRVGVAVSISGMFILFIGAFTDTVIISEAQPVLVDSTEEISYSLSYPMNVTTGATSLDLQTANFGAGERIGNIESVLYNQKISCIQIDMSKQGSPTGTATIGVFGDNNQIIKTFGTIDVSTIITTQKEYRFCLNNHDYYTLSLYDRVGLFYSSGTAGNGVRMYVDNTNPFDSTNSFRSTLSSAGTWTDVTTGDMHFVLTTEEITVNQNNIFDMSDSIQFTLEELHRITISLAGVVIILLGVLYFRND